VVSGATLYNCIFIGRFKTEGMLEVSPETALHFINPTIPDCLRNQWDKSITERRVLDQLPNVRNY